MIKKKGDNMNLNDAIKLSEVLDRLGNKCPICKGILYQGHIGEHYTVWCECGLEIKIKLKKMEQVK